MNKKRPINLDLTTLKFPPMAIASILHRISGILIFVLLPVMLFLLAKSLHSEDSFYIVKSTITHPMYKLTLWAFASAMFYHLLAGIRHMIMDLGVGEHLAAARNSAIVVIVLAIIATIFLGIYLW